MLKTKRDKKICAKYSAKDNTGHVHCKECPLGVHEFQGDYRCKATAHYNRRTKDWVFDDPLLLREDWTQ